MSEDRFRPVRAGIIGIWDYSVQEFRFADGRLVLRGPNGSGKTKALEVLFPFVLDGSIDARRLDPFSGQERTMRSNLLYGGGKTGHGYCWLEFARGVEHVTVGVGMRALEQQTTVKTWFFVVDAVIGETMELLSSERVPLTQRELRAQLGDAQVFERREDHRNAVDRRLFGLGSERYRAMIELVLTLRRPQLAKGLDPEILSDVLSDGLRTIDREILRTSAQAFDNLESAQRELSGLERAEKAVADLLKEWKTYLRARANHRVQDVAVMAARLRVTQAKIEEAEAKIRELEEEVRKARQEAALHRSQIERHEAQMDALRASEAYRNRGQLEDARNAVRNAEEVVERARKAFARVEQARVDAHQTLVGEAARRDEAALEVSSTRGTLWALLRLAGSSLGEEAEIEEVTAWLIARRASVGAVLEEVVSLERAERQLERAETDLLRAIAETETAAESLATARQHLEGRLQDAREAVTAWHVALPEELAEALPLESMTSLIAGFGGEGDLAAEARSAWARHRDRAISSRTKLSAQAESLVEDIEACGAKIEEIRLEKQDAPPAPVTRLASRQDRRGGPLWSLVRFRKALGEADRARIEGALLASGILDAWVDDEGGGEGEAENEAEARDDSLLEPHLSSRGDAMSRNLTDVLEVDAEPPVSAPRIEAILRSISLGDASISVGLDGRFRLGPLRGAHRPEQARYIGARARARHRREKIERLERQRDELGAELAEVRRLAANWEERLRALEEALESLPDPGPSRLARREVEKAAGKLEQAEGSRVQAEVVRAGAERERSSRQRSLHQVASDHAIDPSPDEVRRLESELSEAELVAHDWRAQSQRLHDCEEAYRRADTQHDAATLASGAATADLEEAQRVFQIGEARLGQLAQSLGAEIEEILSDLRRAEEGRAAAQRQLEGSRKREQGAQSQADRQEGVRRAHSEELPDKRADLDRAQAALGLFGQESILAVLGVSDGETPFSDRLAAAVEGASFSSEQLKSTETRLGKRLDRIDDELGTRFHSVRYLEDGLVAIRIADELGEHGLDRFATRLEQRLAMARQLFDEQERQLFEDHLLGSLCSQLRDLIEETQTLVKTMDEAMRQRVLASRKSLGIAWRALQEGDPARKELLRLLRFDPKFLSSERLAKVRSLLSEEVQMARRDRPDRSYLEILEEALDYRRWHRFELTLFDSTGGSMRLSRAAHGRLSGGEKAATLHLPLFAAAHAHFAAARPECPRLVALDEAFAGIDDTGVPELLRLAAAFDLDWFMTGYDLWVTESFLPGVMHYDLAHDPVSRATSAWPILWNGRETVEGDGAES